MIFFKSLKMRFYFHTENRNAIEDEENLGVNSKIRNIKIIDFLKSFFTFLNYFKPLFLFISKFILVMIVNW